MEIHLEGLIEHFRGKGAVMLLESQLRQHPRSRYTYLAALPETEITARGETIVIREENASRSFVGNPWKVLQEFQQMTGSWLFGYLGYDLKNHVEQLVSDNPDAVSAPDMYFMVPRFLLQIDQKTSTCKVLKGNLPAGVSNKEQAFLHTSFECDGLQPQVTREQYLARIAEAKRLITEGEIYEVNLSHQMKGKFLGSPLALYQQMKEWGPVPFGAYLERGDLAVCCLSPERFLLKEGDKILSQPIKGTAKRSNDNNEDDRLKEALVASPKERAENLMIVDLVRNDLSRIAHLGSVKVPQLFQIESFKTVHQMVSTITAGSAADPVTILKACFPMGSMTGAPKIQAMKIIEELEEYRRGIYSGAIGYISPQRNFDFNVVIRTAVIKKKELFYSVGGAITADSKPEDEWEETLIKARALTGLI